jgi:DNA-binding NarL/FixJ family response regulator
MGSKRPDAPRGIEAERFEVSGEEYVAFTWRPAAAARASLTKAERDVLSRIVAGASNEEIARARRSSVRTVANQVASLLRKLEARSRYDLIRLGWRGDDA